MDDITKQELFRELGTIRATLTSIEKNNDAQWDKMEKIDNRLRNQEIKGAGISASIALIVSVGVGYIKQGFGGS